MMPADQWAGQYSTQITPQKARIKRNWRGDDRGAGINVLGRQPGPLHTGHDGTAYSQLSH
jgi:hypothetical protein